MVSAQIKSRERVRELGEVLTADKEVKEMLDLLPKTAWLQHKKFYEPACGNGNFLAEILRRKLSKASKPTPTRFPQEKAEFEILLILGSIYGTDICRRNVVETQGRLKGIIKEHMSDVNPWSTLNISGAFKGLVASILEGNIVEADALNPKKTMLTDWTVPREGYLKPEYHFLSDLQKGESKAAKVDELINFYQMRKLTK
jgi:hypothetical protein